MNLVINDLLNIFPMIDFIPIFIVLIDIDVIFDA